MLEKRIGALEGGGASIFTFELRGGQEDAHAFIDHLEIFSLPANVADVKSLVIHPATTTHSQLSAEELADQGIKPTPSACPLARSISTTFLPILKGALRR